MREAITIERNTKETQIRLTLGADRPGEISIKLGLPFFEHLLTALAFHGGFSLQIEGTGDLEVDPHHLVEDVGLVLGDAFLTLLAAGPVKRYGQFCIPMDDALSEAVVDVCKRPYLVYQAAYPQTHCGSFDLSLIREFLQALANRAQINLHALCRYGANSHHMAEALFKAIGKALWLAYRPAEPGSQGGTSGMSTKGSI
jgi:imidazoleglycerol-phosphate dehydratase